MEKRKKARTSLRRSERRSQQGWQVSHTWPRSHLKRLFRITSCLCFLWYFQNKFRQAVQTVARLKEHFFMDCRWMHILLQQLTGWAIRKQDCRDCGWTMLSLKKKKKKSPSAQKTALFFSTDAGIFLTVMHKVISKFKACVTAATSSGRAGRTKADKGFIAKYCCSGKKTTLDSSTIGSVWPWATINSTCNICWKFHKFRVVVFFWGKKNWLEIGNTGQQISCRNIKA